MRNTQLAIYSWRAAAAVLLTLIGFQAAAQSGAELREGRDYRVLNPAQPTSSPEGKVEITEIFQYSCPHCYSLEPALSDWKTRFPDYVNVVRLPAPWGALGQLHARAFYTAEALGKLDEMHQAFFTEIHVNRNLLDSETALARFFGRFGVDEESFKRHFNSFSTNAKVQRANDLVTRYRVTATPNVVVNGQYLTDGSMAGSLDRWYEILVTLAEREHND